MKVIGLYGEIGAGKSTVADWLVEHRGCIKIGFADGLRQALSTLNPWVNPAYRYQDIVEQFGYVKAKQEFPEIRRLLQVMGTDVIRSVDPDFWVKMWAQAVGDVGEHDTVVVDDLRFNNELAALHAAGNCTIREVVRPRALLQLRGVVHSSEREWREWDFPSIMNVGGLWDLYYELNHGW